ncbi:ABC transporter substrate-binding protein [Paenibacillus sp. BIHB 4019]|uniref:ABC transporter substrate-binding protein n=2 Tax=Paenibacillus sp. BIHB 4019 TaxID=1870819 RepID=A0A1B2DTE2_9BACL|nr:ABC transporter substrate-binding protein [Paenibacillus sp. BIHB 4019]
MTAILVFLVAACSSNHSNENNSSSKPGSSGGGAVASKTKLLFWTFGRADLDFVKSRIEEFNKTNKDNIDVELVSMSENFKQSFEMAVASKQAPDIFMPDTANFIDFAKKGYFEPLDEYMSPEMKQRYEPTKIEGLNAYEGKIYSLPNAGFTIRLVYNKDIFDKVGIANPPATLKEMVEDAQKITEFGKKDGIYGFALNFKNPNSAFERSGVRIAQAMGLGSHGYDFKQGKFDFNMYKDIVQAFKQIRDDGSMLPGVESLDIDPLRAQFAAGKIGMYISYAAEVGVYQSQFPTTIKWAAAPVPTVDGTMAGAVGTNGGTSWMEISSSSEKKEQAWKLFEFLQSDETMVPYAEKGLGIPLAPGVSEKVQLSGDIYGLDYFLPTKYDAMWPVAPTGFLTLDGVPYADTFWKYILVGGKWEEVVKDLNDRYNTALEKAISGGEIKDPKDPEFDASKLQGSLAK